jgi:CTP:molybdopterin cytidylyltransferase MocA
MDAFVTAGGIPGPEDPLHAATRGQPKALLDVAGRPMVQWVLDALSGAARIDRVVVVGLGPEAGITCAKPTTYLPNQGHMLDNIQAGVNEILRGNPGARLVMAVTSDIPAVTSAMIDWVAETCLQTDHDLYYLVIERSLMETRFPGSNRTYVRLKDADLLLLLLSGRLSMERAERMVSRRIGLHGRVILSPYAEVGMDIDKPHQLEILRRDLAARARPPA